MNSFDGGGTTERDVSILKNDLVRTPGSAKKSYKFRSPPPNWVLAGQILDKFRNCRRNRHTLHLNPSPKNTTVLEGMHFEPSKFGCG